MGERGKSVAGPVKARHSPGRVGNIVLDMTRLPLQPISVLSSMSAVCASHTSRPQSTEYSPRAFEFIFCQIHHAVLAALWSLMLVAITAAARSTKVPWPSSGLATHAAFLPGFGPLDTAPIAFESSFARSLGVLVWSGIAAHAARSLLTF